MVLALAYDISGLPGQAMPLYRREIGMRKQLGDKGNESITLGNLSDALRLSGSLYHAEHAACQALLITREQSHHFWEALSLYLFGLVFAARLPSPPAIPDRPPLPTSRWRSLGEGSTPFASKGAVGVRAGEIALRRSRQIFIAQNEPQSEGLTNAYLAQIALWRSDFAAASSLAERAWELAYHSRNERDFIRAARLQGEAALGLGDYPVASEHLHHALTRARAVNYVEEELTALIALAELARQQGDPTLAREHLDDVWEGAERGPYPLFHADALNVLAQIERDAGNQVAAVAAATKAYEKAWCDGISADGKVSYAYWWGLQKAKAHLEALGAPLPNLPPFDPANFEPMPEVEINPKDEYWVDESQIEW